MQTLKYQLYMVKNIKLLIYYSLKGLNIKKKNKFYSSGCHEDDWHSFILFFHKYIILIAINTQNKIKYIKNIKKQIE